MTKPSVLFLVSHSSRGGVQQLCGDLSEGLRSLGFPTTLAALYPSDDLQSRAPNEAAWRHIITVRPVGIVGQFWLLRALMRFLRKERPTLIITAMPAANVIAPLAARLVGGRLQVVATHHSPHNTHNPYLRWVDSWIGSLSNVCKIVSVSHAVARSLDYKPRAYRAKRCVIHNALSPKIETLVTKLAGHHPRARAMGRTVVAVGRLSEEKNYPILLRAAALLPDVRIVVVGAGPDGEMLKKLARALCVEERVQFVGQLPRETTIEILATGDVFAQISLFEGHSLALIEASKLGLPLIVSNAPGQIEATTAKDGTHCGTIVEANDDKALAQSILRLLNDPASYALWSEKARRLAADSSFTSMVSSYANLIWSSSWGSDQITFPHESVGA